jgi:hypothetical protein
VSKGADTDWRCAGWGDHEQGQLASGAELSFRERLLWLQEADRLVAEWETKRAWVDGAGVVHAARTKHGAELGSIG